MSEGDEEQGEAGREQASGGGARKKRPKAERRQARAQRQAAGKGKGKGKGKRADATAGAEPGAPAPANESAVDTAELQARLTRIEAALESQAARSSELMQRLDAVLAEDDAGAAEPKS